MSQNRERFAELLKGALTIIKGLTGKGLEVIKDDIGYELDRSGGGFIGYLTKGHVPAELADVEALAYALVQRQGLDQGRCLQFLVAGDHPHARQLVASWFGAEGTMQHKSERVVELKPFVAGPPITQPRQFFGRAYELRRLARHWRHFPLEHVAIIGPRRSGKTSLLHYLRRLARRVPTDFRPDQTLNWLPDPKAYQWIYLDFQKAPLCQQEGLLRYLVEELDLPEPAAYNLDIVSELLHAHSLQHPTIFLMDEVGAGLMVLGLGRDFWLGLRALLNDGQGGNLGLLMAAHKAPSELTDDQGKTSPLYNMFTEYPLGPFTEAEARALIASAPQPFGDSASEWILQQSGRWPVLVQILCQERLAALEADEVDDRWQEEGLRRIAPWRYLLA